MDTDFIPGKQNNDRSLKVAVVDADQHYKEDLVQYYQQSDDVIVVSFTADTLEELYEHLKHHRVDVVLIHEKETQSHPAWYRQLLDYEVLKMIVVADQLSLMQETEVIHENVDLVYKFTPIGTYTQKILAFSPKGKEKDIFTQVNTSAKEQTDQKMALFYSPKGGVGTTTIAVNTASQLALKEKKVLLVDFAVFGHVSIAFNLPQQSKGLSDVISYIEQGRKNEAELEDVIQNAIETVSMQGKKLYVLNAGSPLKMTSLTLEQTDTIMRVLNKLDYDVVVLDTSTDLSERNISLMSYATDLFFVMMTDVAANWSMLSSVDILRKLNSSMQNRYLLINAYHDAIGFPISEMESMLSMKVSAVIPYKYEQVQGYANRGVAMAEKPMLKINKHYRSIAHLIEPIFTKSELAKRNGLQKGVFS